MGPKLGEDTDTETFMITLFFKSFVRFVTKLATASLFHVGAVTVN